MDQMSSYFRSSSEDVNNEPMGIEHEPGASSQSISNKTQTDEEPRVLENHSVPEKIIFCLDQNIFSPRNKNGFPIRELRQAITGFMEVKKKIASKRPEFFVLTLGEEAKSRVLIPLLLPHDLSEIFNQPNFMMACNNQEESQQFDFSEFFSALAKLTDLPDPTFYSLKEVTPPYVCHVILLFSRFYYIPKMENPNPYYFLVDNPYFTLDILYVKGNRKMKNNQSALIGKVLSSLVNGGEGKGFFYEHENGHPGISLNKFLGHCLIRSRTPMFNLSK